MPLASYHEDVLAFMSQPPDDYEVLRQRFRNLPGLSAGNTEPLFHNVEADLPQTTGGDLGLVPPILRKYWAYFMAYGPFHTWDQAVGWLQALPHEERAIASKFLGFEHLDLRQYMNSRPFAVSPDYLSTAAKVLAVEERQRLTDLVKQFDLLLGDPQLDENFQFWRGYLQDKAHLHRLHPDHLGSLQSSRANDIAEALSFLNDLQGSPTDRAQTIQERVPLQPYIVNFLPAVDNRTLVELFAGGADLPEAPTLQATASFVERLQRFASLAEGILERGRESPPKGALALVEFLEQTDLEQEQDLKLFFDLFHDADPPEAHRIMSAIDKKTVRQLMPRVPVQLRTLMRPERLLEKLDVTVDATPGDLHRGITLLIEEPSGNYRIDEPFLAKLYEVVNRRTVMSPEEAVRMMAATPFPLEGMILNQPAAVSMALSADLEAAVALVESSDPVVSPPARILYRLISADPLLAARLVIELDGAGRVDLVTESLAYIAYDKVRTEKYPALGISLDNDGEFLSSLLELKSDFWLYERISGVVSVYRQRTEREEVGQDFLYRYRETLDAAAEHAEGDSRQHLKRVISKAFE